MAILKIVNENEEIIRKKSKEVKVIDERIIRLLDDMHDTLIKSNGVGLAAVQVGYLKRIVLVDTGEEILELINPQIIEAEGKQEELEGCLSCPNKWGFTSRPEMVTVKALDRNGKPFTKTGYGLTARAFCHELDHLDGILFSDNAIRMLTQDEIKEMLEDDDE